MTAIDGISSEFAIRDVTLPEQTTIILFGLGLLGLAGTSRKKY